MKPPIVACYRVYPAQCVGSLLACPFEDDRGFNTRLYADGKLAYSIYRIRLPIPEFLAAQHRFMERWGCRSGVGYYEYIKAITEWVVELQGGVPANPNGNFMEECDE